jgi:hypothetical protein
LELERISEGEEEQMESNHLCFKVINLEVLLNDLRSESF